MDGGAWWTTVHGVAKSWTRMRDLTNTHHGLPHIGQIKEIYNYMNK